MIYYWETFQGNVKTIVNYKINNAKIVYERNPNNPRKYLKIGSGFDTETSRIELPGITTSYLYHWQFALDEYTIGGRSLDSLQEFYEYLLSTIPNDRYLLVPDANLGYEYQFCKRRWYELGMTDLFAKEKRNPLKFIVGNKIEMREVIGLFGYNLADIADNYATIKKLKDDLDYDKVRLSNTPLTIKEMAYCENDVQILSQLCNYIYDNFYGKKPAMPMTKTGIIRKKVKSKITNIKCEKNRIQSNLPKEEVYNALRKYLFKGGICGTSSRYMNKVLYNVVCADYTSDYPAVMNHYLFPDGRIREIAPKEFMEYKNLPYIAVIRFKDFKSRTCHSLMSTHKALDFDRRRLSPTIRGKSNPDYDPSYYVIDNGRLFYAKEVVFVVNDVEYKALQNAYTWKSAKVERCWDFEKYRLLPYWVRNVLNTEYLNKEKLKSEDKRDTLAYKNSKEIVNGCFGMMCTAIFMDELTFDGWEIEPPRDEDGNIIKKSFSEAIKGMFLNPFWGFWITSYARALLMEVISKFPDCIVQYDTDSIYYVKDHPQAPELEKFIVDYNNKIYKTNSVLFDNNPHYKTLGAWEVDPPFKRFKGLGSKRYMYEYWYEDKENPEESGWKIKTVVAGCRKGTIKAQYEDDVKSGKFEGSIFDYFSDGLVIDKEHSKKLASKYIDKYGDSDTIIVDYKDYKGNTEKIKLESAVVLEPIEFHMGLSPLHINFYESIQSIYNNTPSSSPLCKFLEEILYGED